MELFVEAIDREVDDLRAERHPAALHRRCARLAARARSRACALRRRSTAAGDAHDAQRRDRLRRPLGHRRRRRAARSSAAWPASSSRTRSTRPRSRSALQLGGRARSGSLHPHGRRAAHQQFPAVEPGVHGALFLRRRCGRISTTTQLERAFRHYAQPAAALRAHRGASRQWLIPCVNACSPRCCSPAS